MSFTKPTLIKGVQYRVCVDSCNEYGDVSGNIFYCYSKEPESFFSSMQLMVCLENAMDRLNYPQRSTSVRHFNDNLQKEKTEVIKYMDENDFKDKSGQKATFVVEIKYRENATWQGTVKWIEGKKEQNFRSALELIKLLDDAVESN